MAIRYFCDRCDENIPHLAPKYALSIVRVDDGVSSAASESFTVIDREVMYQQSVPMICTNCIRSIIVLLVTPSPSPWLDPAIEVNPPFTDTDMKNPYGNDDPHLVELQEALKTVRSNRRSTDQ